MKKRGTAPYAGIIVGSDLSDASVAALETAVGLFQPSQITLYHAFDMPYRGLIADKKAYEANARANALNEEEHSRPTTWEPPLTVSTSKSAMATRHPA